MESLTSATWLIIDVILLLLYIAFLVYTIIRILLDTSSSSKALAYLLLVMLLPLFGCIFYFAFGINYRHRKIKNRAVETQSKFLDQFKAHVPDETESILESKAGLLSGESSLVRFIYNLGYEPISKNRFQLLVNGEEKFPDVLKSLEQAKVFIHMEYYAWENDVRGNQIKEVLLKKAANGVTVRVLYDA
jgi:cardiolipin synthase